MTSFDESERLWLLARSTRSVLYLFSIMSCQTLSALTHLLTEVNESVEEWKENSHKMEKNRDYWRKRAVDLEKKLYCKQCLSQQKEVEDLNDTKVKRKTELDWLREGKEAALQKPLRRQLDKDYEEFQENKNQKEGSTEKRAERRQI